MSNEGKILDLVLNGAGRAAPELTHDLSTIGNGNMAEGIAQIAEYCGRTGYGIGKEAGMVKGVCIGLVAAAAGVGASFLYKWHIQKVEEEAAMWQRFDDKNRADNEAHWAEFEELKAKAGQESTEAVAEEPVP